MIAIHYLTQGNAIAILEKWVGGDHKQKTDIFSDRQFNQIFNLSDLPPKKVWTCRIPIYFWAIAYS
jgi:hypothetical protein